MRSLLRLLAAREIAARPAYAALIAGSVAAGVFLLVAAEPTIAVAERALEGTVAHAIGRAALAVTGTDDRPLDGALTAVARGVPGVAHVVPVVDARARLVPSGQTVRLIGLPILGDGTKALFRDTTRATTAVGWMMVGRLPDRVAVSERLAARIGVRLGSTLTVATPTRGGSFEVAAIVRDRGLPLGTDDALIMRLDAAQALVDAPGRIDRLEVSLVPGADPSVVREALAARLGPGARVDRQRARAVADSMIGAFTLTAGFLGMVVLAASAFVVFGAVFARLAERRREVAVWRILGATRPQTAVLMIVDALAIGGLGSLAGVGLGITAAPALVRVAAALVGGLTLRAPSVEGIVVTPSGLMVAGLAGLTATAGASVLAIAAHALSTDGERLRALLPLRTAAARWRSIAGLACLVPPWVAAAAGSEAIAGPLSCALVVPATFLLAPAITAWSARLILAPLAPALPGPTLVAARALARDRFRLALPITALALSIEVGTAVGVIADSFASGLRSWLQGLTRESLLVTPARSLVRSAAGGVDPALAARLASVAGVGRVEPTRVHTLTLGDGDVELRVSGLSDVRREDLGRYRFVAGVAEDALAQLARGEGVIVSESFAHRRGLRVGDPLPLPAPYGVLPARVVGVVVDLSAPGGTIVIGRSAYLAHWDDPTIDGFFVDLTPGTDPAAVRRRIESEILGNGTLAVLSPPEMVHEVEEMVDHAMRPLRALAMVAFAVGLCGMLHALRAAAIVRSAERATLSAAGASRAQITAAVLAEGVAACAVAAALGGIGGALGAYGWLRGTIPAVSGWLVPYAVPIRPFVSTVASAVVVAAAALLWPSMRVTADTVERWSLR